MKNFKKITHHVFLFLFFAMILSPVVIAQQVEENKPPETIKELRKAMLQVLRETGTPAAGIALVDSTGPVWIEGLGKADIEQEIEADEETMFRIGSTSKIFIALAVLKLQEEGELSLKDRVRDLVPEIKFTNPWKDTDPILIEHLLEHTTGWDDMHPPELVNDSTIMSLKKALDLHPHSRKSRWVPGTRFAYSNIGPNVAAYIVEKITGQTFEEYIQANFFSPMNIKTMTYIQSEDYKQKGATLYKGGHPSNYWHMIMRPSGSINASPRNMANVVQLFINRGKIDSRQLISVNSLKRMETPSTTSGARTGLDYGYGLGLYTSPHKNFTYYKHGGGVGNGISDFSYLPEYGVGYSIMINSGNAETIWKLATLVRNFQTHHLQKAKKSVSGVTSRPSRSVNGYYQIINPINSLGFNLPSLTPRSVWTEGDTLYTKASFLFGETEKYVPVSENLYQSVKTKRAELIFVNDPLAGEVIELANVWSGTITFGSIPRAYVIARVVVFILWIIFMILAVLALPVWSFRYWRGKIPGGTNVRIRIWNLLPLVFLILSYGLLASGAMDGIELLAKPSFFSVGVMISTIGFFTAALFSLIMAVRYKNRNIKRSVYIPATILSGLHTLVAFYFLWHGLIGLMTWA